MKDKAYKLADEKGLYLYVLPSGFKSWRMKYRHAGKERRLTFGGYPEVSLSEARDLRDEARRLLRGGQDPAEVKRQRTAAQEMAVVSTFERQAREWIAAQAPTWSPRYARIVERSFDQDVLPRLGRLPIAAITTPMVVEVLRPIEARGAIETAHRVRQRISEVFARAIAGGLATHDPATIAARSLPKARKGKFPAVRTIARARAVLTATEAQPGHPLTKLASRMLALTAVRSAVVRLAEPGEFENLDGLEPIWRVPASKMKLLVDRKVDAAFDFVVPLSRQAAETIRVAIDFSQPSRPGELIFRSVRTIRKPISDSTISKAYREAGFSGEHVPHGWRATFSTVMNERAIEDRPGDRAVIDLMLAHIPKGVEAAYNRAAYMARRRQIAQEWADMLVDGLASPEALLLGKRTG